MAREAASCHLTVVHIAGADNIVADAMSRWAYPASQGYGDISIHGGEEDDKAMEEIIAKEREEEKKACFVVQVHNIRDVWETAVRERTVEQVTLEIAAITRSGRVTNQSENEDNGTDEESEEEVEPPRRMQTRGSRLPSFHIGTPNSEPPTPELLAKPAAQAPAAPLPHFEFKKPKPIPKS